MSQNPRGPDYNNPYESGPSNPTYPPTPGAGYGAVQPPSGPYNQYAPPPPPQAGPVDSTPNSAYGVPPYNPSYPQSMPNPVSGPPPAGPYDPTAFSQSSGANYPPYTQPGNPGYGAQPSSPAYGAPLSNPGYGAQPSSPGYNPIITNTPNFGVPGGMPPFTPPVKKSKTKAIVISTIALLFVVGGILSLVLYNNQQTTTHNNNSTATAQTQLQQAQTTGTAQANATANAQATATYVQTHYPFSSDLVLNDSLKDNSGVAKYGWDVDSGCTFTNGSYEATEKKANFILPCTAQNTNFTNFTFEIQMTIKGGGDTASGGVIFRANMNTDALYVLFLDSQGNYELDLRANSSGSSTRKLRSGLVSGFATGLYQVHTIGIVANGSQITAYVDQNQIARVSDSSYAGGQIGVIADYGTSTTIVAYSNAKVWKI